MNRDVIELLDSDDDDENELLTNIAPVFAKTEKKPPPPSSSASATAAAPAAATATTTGVDVLTPIGTSSFSIRRVDPVAINLGDELVLVRELDNVNHRVSVRADNLQGRKIGYVVDAESAMLGQALAVLGSDKIKVAATVQPRLASDYHIPVTVDFFAKAQHNLSSFELKPLEDTLRMFLKGNLQRVAKKESAPRVTLSPTATTTTLTVVGDVVGHYYADVLLGTCDFSVVGTQYYPGAARKGDVVVPTREPSNVHDKNAVRFDNKQGQQIGHLKADQAKLLSPLMADSATLLALPSGGQKNAIIFSATVLKKTSRTMAVTLSVYITANMGAGLTTAHVQSLRGTLKTRLGYYFRPATGNGSTEEAKLAPAAAAASASSSLVAAPAAADAVSDANHLSPIGTCDFLVVRSPQYSEFIVPGMEVWLVRDTGSVRVSDTNGLLMGQIHPNQAVPLAELLGNHVAGNLVKLTARLQFGVNTAMTVKVDFSFNSSGVAVSSSAIDKMQATMKVLFSNFQSPVAGPPTKRTADDDFSIEAALGIGKSDDPEVLMSTVEWESQNADQLDEMFDKQANDKIALLPDYPMPALLAGLHLFDHQKEGIRWLIHQERGELPPYFEETESGTGRKVWRCKITKCQLLTRPLPVRGGILADDMGLGKTLQTIALIISNPPKGLSYPIPSRLRTQKKTNAPRCTLVLSPLTVMANWKLEINKHVNNRVPNRNLTVAIYHGQNREEVLMQVRHGVVDVLLASYHTIASDYKTYVAAQELEIDKKPEEKPVKKKRRRAFHIFDIPFHRIVLDEAHIIRSSKTGFFKAANLLQAERRLCLTGTPFVNKPTDIHSLLSFLGVQPLAQPKVFSRLVVEPIKERKEIGLATIRTTMAHVALRRIKTEVDKNIDLVKKTVNYCTIGFPDDSDHKENYDNLYTAARDVFLGLLRLGDDVVLSRFMEVLALVLRIRQACVHMALVPEDYRERAKDICARSQKRAQSGATKQSADLGKEEGENLLEQLQGHFKESQLVECAVCMNELEEDEAVILRGCKHIFCETCLNTIRNSLCPMCRTSYTAEDMIKKQAAKEATQKQKVSAAVVVKKHGRSPKIQAMLDTIDQMKPDEKAVIFSQWTSVLDIIEVEFRALGHTFTRIDGSMSAHERYNAMEAFDTEGCYEMSTPRFILCSLHACGTGINLVRANVVFMLDPWWNVAAENQAMDRVHRIGQKRPVRVMRLVMKDSIEERLVALQDSKAALGKGAMEKLKPEEKRKARLTALRDLFQVPEDEEWN